jgi:arsenate reductase
MAIKVYHYAKCSTCRKALKWLDGHGVAYDAVDIVTTPPKRAELKRALAGGLPLKKLFNTSGQSYREGGWGARLESATEAQALDALVEDGKLVKRPFVLAEGGVLVGFDEPSYRKVLRK